MRGAVIVAALVLAGCNSTEQATTSARSRWIGQQSDSFFVANGAPKQTHNLSGGGRVYTWENVSRPAGITTRLICSADIVADASGRISEVRIREDGIGMWNMSRCSEIFG
jgi:hypothetical protein